MTVKSIKEKLLYKSTDKHKFISLFYQLSGFYNLLDIKNKTLDYIYRWFTTVARTENFRQLEFNLVKKILSSCELHISSELEVFNASEFWLSCENFDRSEYAKRLFLNIRFPLLSDNVVKSLLEQCEYSGNISSFHKSEECLTLVNEVLKNKNEF